MPTFFTIAGVKICLYFNDHNPPHFHALFAEYEVLIAIKSLKMLEGSLPKKKLKIVKEFAPLNRALVQKREDIQSQLDDWYTDNPDKIHNMKSYKAFLKKINYLVPEGKAFSVNPSRVDPELATIAGPQLVVPIMNARYALNAANARWGSLYDALYGTDAIADDKGAERTKAYNPKRGKKVIDWGRKFLDKSAYVQT